MSRNKKENLRKLKKAYSKKENNIIRLRMR
jgi:hypothetical protein